MNLDSRFRGNDGARLLLESAGLRGGRHGRTPISPVRHAQPARGTEARSGHRCTRGSDLFHHVLRVPRRGPRGGALQHGARRARSVPAHFTTSFVFRDADHAAALFNMERGGHVYSRISNPTNAVLEERVAALEGGVGAIATASGQAALHLAVATIAGAGSHVV